MSNDGRFLAFGAVATLVVASFFVESGSRVKKKRTEPDPPLVAASGPKATIVYGRRFDDTMPAKEFIESRDPTDQANLARAMQTYAELGRHPNETKFKIETGAAKERSQHTIGVFKHFQSRVAAVLEGRTDGKARVVLTHGFSKKQDKMDLNEIDRADRLFEENEALYALKRR